MYAYILIMIFKIKYFIVEQLKFNDILVLCSFQHGTMQPFNTLKFIIINELNVLVFQPFRNIYSIISCCVMFLFSHLPLMLNCNVGTCVTENIINSNSTLTFTHKT